MNIWQKEIWVCVIFHLLGHVFFFYKSTQPWSNEGTKLDFVKITLGESIAVLACLHEISTFLFKGFKSGWVPGISRLLQQKTGTTEAISMMAMGADAYIQASNQSGCVACL